MGLESLSPPGLAVVEISPPLDVNNMAGVLGAVLVVMSPDVTLELVKGGDHRLSKPADLARLSRTLSWLLDASPG